MPPRWPPGAHGRPGAGAAGGPSRSTSTATAWNRSKAGSITRAADRLGHTPPALSQQLAELEREAGAVLLVRHHRGARLTEAGEVLVARARRVLDELEQARHEPARLTGLTGGSLRLGTFPTAGVHLLPPALSAFRRAHPDVTRSVAYRPDGPAPAADAFRALLRGAFGRAGR